MTEENTKHPLLEFLEEKGYKVTFEGLKEEKDKA